MACQQSSKNSATFKLVVHSDAERNKRYEFEAENPKMASEFHISMILSCAYASVELSIFAAVDEIVQTIRSLKTALERPGTIKQSRRSRHVS